jgi:hypothetical protein
MYTGGNFDEEIVTIFGSMDATVLPSGKQKKNIPLHALAILTMQSFSRGPFSNLFSIGC